VNASRPPWQRFSENRALIGVLQTRPSREIADLATQCGYDFVLMDCEHGLFCETDCLEMLPILACRDTLALVRVRDHDPKTVGRLLDIGVDAVVVPQVSTAEEANTLARAVRYPPDGTRSFGASLHRSTRYGLAGPMGDPVAERRPRLLIMIESANGVRNVDEIVAVEGVDGVIIGPWDLTASLGKLGDFSPPAYLEATSRIERAVVARNKLLGTASSPEGPLEALAARGYRLLIVGADISLVRDAMVAQVSQARANVSGRARSRGEAASAGYSSAHAAERDGSAGGYE
jgi:4-hydroxy-2-oxoheptanedioate aldolase